MDTTNKPEIESKNLTILEDQLNHEALGNKKCDVYANMFTDANIKCNILIRTSKGGICA